MSSSLLLHLTDEARARGIELKLPRPLDAGFDLPLFEQTTIPARGFALLPTGVHAAIPEGWVGLVRDRSSMALRGGVTVAGVIDASYRGEIKVAMHNLSSEPLELAQGERIAQCVIVPHLISSQAALVDSLAALGQTSRGAAGFGSTGK